MNAPSGPSRALPKLTASLLPDGNAVAGALARRARSHDQSVHRRGADESGDIYAGLGADDADTDEGPHVEELPPVREAREREREARGRTPGHRVQADEGPRTYTLGELVEMVRTRKSRARAIVRSGDIDGDEAEIDEDDILLKRTRSPRTR